MFEVLDDEFVGEGLLFRRSRDCPLDQDVEVRRPHEIIGVDLDAYPSWLSPSGQGHRHREVP
jgi:hypothetical protein